jgi:hypothetical protein
MKNTKTFTVKRCYALANLVMLLVNLLCRTADDFVT